jgi:hypothetical protein
MLALGSLPALQEIIEAGEALLERLLGEVAQGLRDNLPCSSRYSMRSAMMYAPTPST